MTFAKALIIMSLLWPVPLGYGLYYWVYKPMCSTVASMTSVPISESEWQFLKLISDWVTGPLSTMPLFGIEYGYWWPMLAIFGAGLIFAGIVSCIAKTDPDYLKQGNKINPAIHLVFLNVLGVILVAVMWIVIFTLAVVYWFIVSCIIKPYFFAIVIGIVVLTGLLCLGVYGILQSRKQHKE